MKDDKGNETTKLNQAYVTGRLGALKVVAGKTDQYLGEGNLYDDTAELVGLTYGKDVKINAYYGKPTDYGYDKFYGANLSGKIGKLTLAGGYDKFEDALNGSSWNSTPAADVGEDNAVWNVGANYNFGDFILGAIYLHSDVDSAMLQSGADTDGYVISASYKGAKAAKQGSWGLWGKYYDQGAGTFVAHTMKSGDWGKFMNEGFKGYGIGVTYTLAKNMVYNLDYYDLEGKISDKDSRVLWNRLQITF